jgi:hypothetical protein
MTPELAVALGAAGYAAYRNCLVGNPAPMVRCYFDRARNCQWIAFPADPVQVIDFTRGC